MSEIKTTIPFPKTFGWHFPMRCRIVPVHDWDGPDLEIQCCNVGCYRQCTMEYEYYKGGDVRFEGGDSFDSGMYYAYLTCDCFAPVCWRCIAVLSRNGCRICGNRHVDVEKIRKSIVMEKKNTRRDLYNRDFWFMMLDTSVRFNETNFPGGDYPDFLRWFFLKTGTRIDITKINSQEMCDMVDKFRLHKAKYSFLRLAFPVMNRFSAEVLREPSKLRFIRFFMTSETVCRFLAIDSFSGNRCAKVFPFLGLTKKIVERLTCAFWFFNGTHTQDLSWFFVRLIARYFQKRLRF